MLIRTLLRFLFICFICISCNQVKDSADALELKIRENGRIHVYDTRTNRPIIKELTASYTDLNNREIPFPDKDLKINTYAFSDKMGSGTETILEASAKEGKMHIKWTLRTFSYRPVLIGKLDVTNLDEEPVRINTLKPFCANQKNAGIVSGTIDTLRYLDIEPLTWAPKSIQIMEDRGLGKFVTALATSQDSGAVIGCVSFNKFRGYFEMEDHRESSGLIAFCTYHNVDSHLMLDTGQTLSSEWIYIDCVNDVLTGLEEWARLAGEYNNAVVSDPPATGFYTWYYYRDYVSEKIMLDNARFLAENRDRFPVNYVHIDWGWQRKFSTGDTIANDKFPHGLKWLAGGITELGFSPSIWVNPFMYTNPSAEAVIHNPEIFLRDTIGNLVKREPIRNIMGREFGNMEYMILDGVTNILDVSNPGAYDFLRKRYRWVSSMGYRMAMMDFIQEGRNNENNGERLKYTNVSTYEGIRKALTAAREGLGENTDILGCGTVYETCVGISNLTRISSDAPAIWSCVKVACNDIILQYFMNNTLWTNYADGLFVRDKISPYWRKDWWDENGNLVPMYLTDDEARFYTAVTGLSQSAVMYTEDIRLLKPDRQWLLSMVLPIYQNGKFRPVDLFKTSRPKTLKLTCEEGNRKWIVAAGLNWTDQVDENGLDLSMLELQEGVEYHAFDVFKQEYTGLANSDMQLAPVNPHGVLLVNLVVNSERPQVVGSDLHISQGGVEINDEIWDESRKELTVTLNDLYGRKGHVFVHVPLIYDFIPGNNIETQVAENGKLLKIPVVLDGEKSFHLNFN